MGKFKSTKTYKATKGFSCCFRQYKAKSHCKFLHGYSLEIKIVFEAENLDERNWVVDFGGLKPLKAWLEETFDHKVVIDVNDPKKDNLLLLETQGLASIVQLEGVGVEKFAEHAWRKANEIVNQMTNGRCKCVRVECAEHGANSAIYEV